MQLYKDSGHFAILCVLYEQKHNFVARQKLLPRSDNLFSQKTNVEVPTCGQIEGQFDGRKFQVFSSCH